MRGIAVVVSLAIATLEADASSRQGVLTRYCVTCHNTRTKAGGFVLEGVPAGDPAASPEIWEKVVRRVQAGEMPPAGIPSPGQDSLKALAAELIKDLDAAA